MALDQKDKELAAIGASIGTGCLPCIEHHIPAGRNAGLTEPELAWAVEVADATHRIAAELLFGRSRELLHGAEAPASMPLQAEPTSRPDELVALGASIGANCHPLAGALKQGLTASQVRSAIKMAEIVQQHAADITAGKAAAFIEAAGLNPAAIS